MTTSEGNIQYATGIMNETIRAYKMRINSTKILAFISQYYQLKKKKEIYLYYSKLK